MTFATELAKAIERRTASSLHPVFEQITQDFARSAIGAHKAQVEAYVILLKRHDWHYDYSDDYRVVLKGRGERNELNMIQREIDPRFEIWNEYAPEQFKRVAA